MQGSSVTVSTATDSFPWCWWLTLKEIEWRAWRRQHWLNQWSVQVSERHSSNLAELLRFPHLCRTYPVTGKQQRTKHKSVSTYLNITLHSINNQLLLLFISITGSTRHYFGFKYIFCIKIYIYISWWPKISPNVPVFLSTDHAAAISAVDLISHC